MLQMLQIKIQGEKCNNYVTKNVTRKKGLYSMQMPIFNHVTFVTRILIFIHNYLTTPIK